MLSAGKSQTAKTSIPEWSNSEQALYEDLFMSDLMPASMEQLGFKTEKTETTWDGSDQQKSFADRRERTQEQLAQYKDVRMPSEGTLLQRNRLNQELAQIDREETEAKDNFEPEVTWDTRPAYDPRTEQIIRDKGIGSAEAKNAILASEESDIQRYEKTRQLEDLSIDRAMKVVSGDLSLNEGEQKFFDQVIGPLKEAYGNTVTYLRESADEMGSDLNKAVDAFVDQVGQTKMSMSDAITEIETRVKDTGQTMSESLKESIELSKAQAKMGLEDFSLETRQQLQNQAASLGRSATDPRFIKQFGKDVMREMERQNLALSQQEVQGKMAIQERTGTGLEEAAKMRFGVEERTGQQLESATQQRLGIAENVAGLRTEAARAKGAGGVSVAQAAGNLRGTLAYGLAPQQIAAGLDVARYNQALKATEAQNAQAASNMPFMASQYLQKERIAQPTTTTTQGFGAMDVIGGLVGTGLRAASVAKGF
ncbi:MAG: hypothetical protein UY96_C0032G0005 [Parcubacteria group bacterium GW2011_GWB1_56_8]|nr:MAG: hypothetical protein UY96_C0032G0005 [Parcubacteria group bacterium GW2011_GWB1_56_8]